MYVFCTILVALYMVPGFFGAARAAKVPKEERRLSGIVGICLLNIASAAFFLILLYTDTLL